MASENRMLACSGACGKMTLHIAPRTSHILHLLLSVITLGVWLLVWYFVALSTVPEGRAQCTVCGATYQGVKQGPQRSP